MDLRVNDSRDVATRVASSTKDASSSSWIAAASSRTASQQALSGSARVMRENLLSFENGARVLFCTDEWFAPCENLIKDSDPSFDPDAYCAQGKVMDGWESRRKRGAGHDWCVIQLTQPGCLDKLTVDTAFFTGNQTPAISIQAMTLLTDEEDDDGISWMPGAVKRLLKHGGGIQGTGQSPQTIQKAQEACNQHSWTTILERTPLQPGYEESRHHSFSTPFSNTVFTHVRINYYPDGGVARIRIHGQPKPLLNKQSKASNTSPLEHDLAALSLLSPYESRCVHSTSVDIPSHHLALSLHRNGGKGITCSNAHYGVPDNLIQDTSAINMGDGWETARHSHRPSIWKVDDVTGLLDTPLMDWAVLQLGMGGTSDISRIIIDTHHFRGNYPESVSIQCTDNYAANHDKNKTDDNTVWYPLLPRTRVGPDAQHVFDTKQHQLIPLTSIMTHVRICIYPDGGISRIHIYGAPRNTPQSHL